MLLRAAAVPPSEAREHLAAVVESAVVPGLGLTPIPADRLHILVAQFGNVPTEEARKLSPTLAEAMPDLGPAPTLRMAGGSVADERSSQVVVAAVTGDAQRLADLARDVGVVVTTRRLYVDRRRFHPVLPVALLDPGTSADAADGLLSALADYQGPEWTLDALSLMRGTWAGDEKAAGPVYEEFESFSFQD
jgi:2'-5' RNA ligase